MSRDILRILLDLITRLVMVIFGFQNRMEKSLLLLRRHRQGRYSLLGFEVSSAWMDVQRLERGGADGAVVEVVRFLLNLRFRLYLDRWCPMGKDDDCRVGRGILVEVVAKVLWVATWTWKEEAKEVELALYKEFVDSGYEIKYEVKLAFMVPGLNMRIAQKIWSDFRFVCWTHEDDNGHRGQRREEGSSRSHHPTC